MVVRIIVFAAAVWVWACAGAHAEPTTADVKKMDDMIAQARAGDVFANETKAEGELIARHKPTGMTCRFILGLGKLSYDAMSGSASCVMRRSSYGYALAAVHVAPGTTLEAGLNSVVEGIANGRSIRELPLSKLDLTIAEQGKAVKSLTKRFQVGGDYWRLSVARAGNWLVVMEVISPTAPNPMADVQQGLEWNENLKGLDFAGDPAKN